MWYSIAIKKPSPEADVDSASSDQEANDAEDKIGDSAVSEKRQIDTNQPEGADTRTARAEDDPQAELERIIERIVFAGTASRTALAAIR